MEFVDIIKKYARMQKKACDSYYNCNSCPYDKTDICELIDAIHEKVMDDPEKFEEMVIEWDKTHPVITNYDKLKELIKENFDTIQEEIFIDDKNIVFGSNFFKNEYIPKRK